MKKKKVWPMMLAAVVVVAVIGILLLWQNKDRSAENAGVLDEIYGYKGYSRTISKEEYEFYKYFVTRDLSGKESEEEVEALVKEYAGNVNALFYLGNKLGYCEAYSFEALQLRMEQENVSRQKKLAEGEVVYGLEQFNSLEIYFQYLMDNMQVSIQGYLEDHADDQIREMAKNYYEEHEEEFTGIEEVVYEQTIDGKTETVSADAETISFYGKSDGGLADFIADAQIGDVYEDIINDQERRIVLKEITYSETGYENNQETALYSFVRNELYDMVIKKTAENNPVTFE